MDDPTAVARRRKFNRYFAQRNNYRIFVGIPLAQPRSWDEVLGFENDTLTAADLRIYGIGDIRSWVVAYANTGEIVDAENLFAPLPPGVNFIKSEKLPLPKFSDADLRHGRTLIRIRFGKSPTHPENPAYYSTSLTNISRHKVRCLSFGGYLRTNEGFKLSTVTRTLFSASQFIEWYGVRHGGWIEPGETVSDPSNYGLNGFWVYHCETDQTIKFHAGGNCPSSSFLGKLLKPFLR